MLFRSDKGKTHSSGKLLFGARVIPYRGSWLDFEFDAKDIIYVRIDRRRKLPVTSLLFALDLTAEDILGQFYKNIHYKHTKDGWVTAFDPERMRNYKASTDIKNAKTGDVVIEAGRKLTPRAARKLAEEGLKQLLIPAEELYGRYLAFDMVNGETGEIYAEAGDEVTEQLLEDLDNSGFDELSVLDIDHVNTGPYIRNTLMVDKNQSREQALIDIYRVMRPGEPPTIDTAEAMFQSLFFDAERYDLSAVGRVKMNMRMDLDAPDTHRTLRREDIVAVVRALVELREIGRAHV